MIKSWFGCFRHDKEPRVLIYRLRSNDIDGRPCCLNPSAIRHAKITVIEQWVDFLLEFRTLRTGERLLRQTLLVRKQV